jgi:hypothetical protein
MPRVGLHPTSGPRPSGHAVLTGDTLARAHRDPEPAIAIAAPVYDKARRRIGGVEGVEIDKVSGRITRIIVRRDLLFPTETAIPASLIASVGDDGARSTSAPTR